MMDTADSNIGRILKERREELGRSLQDAADATRIRKTYLESLEDNRFSDLPGRTYVMGFIRVYAAYLGLKSNPLVSRFNDLQGVETEPAATVPAAVSTSGLTVKHAADGDWRKFFLAFLLVLALGCLLYYLLAVYSSDAPTDDSAKKAVANGAKQTEPDQPPPGSAPSASGAE